MVPDWAALGPEPLLRGSGPVPPAGQVFLIPGVAPVAVDDGTVEVGKVDHRPDQLDVLGEQVVLRRARRLSEGNKQAAALRRGSHNICRAVQVHCDITRVRAKVSQADQDRCQLPQAEGDEEVVPGIDPGSDLCHQYATDGLQHAPDISEI